MKNYKMIQRVITGGIPLKLKGIYNCSKEEQKKFIISNLDKPVYINDIEIGDYLDIVNEKNEFLSVGKIIRIYRLHKNVIIDTDKDLTVSLETF